MGFIFNNTIEDKQVLYTMFMQDDTVRFTSEKGRNSLGWGASWCNMFLGKRNVLLW